MDEHDALRMAVSMYRQPLLKSRYHSKPIPRGMLLLIKIAAGSEDTCQEASEELQESPQLLRDASVFYLQQVLAKPQLDAYGCLCLAPGAAAAAINLHKRWLLKWLHPDRNSNRWETVLFQRVLGAAEKLEHVTDSVAPKGSEKETVPVRQISRHRSQSKRSWSRPAPVFSWRSLIKRALKPIVVLGAISLLVVGAISQFSDTATGSGQLFALLGW
jgi:hypothetical protein